MIEVITHAPIQTRSNTLQHQERLFSLLASETIIRLNEFQTGKEYPRVDIWNVIGLKAEKDYQLNNVFQTREEYAQEQVSQRYQLLKDTYEIPTSGRVSILDDSPEYQQVVTKRIETLIKDRVIEVGTQKYRKCSDCEYVYVLAQSPITRCPTCHSPSFKIVEKNGFTFSFNQETRAVIGSNISIFPKTGQAEYRKRVATIPPILQLSRQREHGHDLSSFGVDHDFVLDPNFSVAMIGSVIDELGLGKLTTIVQGIDSIGNLAPYQKLFDSNQDIRYLTHGTVPGFMQENVAKNPGFYFPYLTLNALSLPKGINQNQFQNFFKEYQRFSGQAKFALNKLKDSPPSNFDPDFTNVFKLFNRYSFRDGLTALKDIIYHDLSNSSNSPSIKFLEDLKTLLNHSLGLKIDNN